MKHTNYHEIQYLLEVLQRYREDLKTWGKVARAINDASKGEAGPKIDWRTLRRICEKPDTVQLKLHHLIAIDRWLRIEREGELLARHRSLIDSLCESYNLNILVACKTFDELNYEFISRWDLRAVSRLLRSPLNRLNYVIWDIEGAENWPQEDVRITNAANISIASPVASYPSQAIMSKMIGIHPYRAIDFQALPFFVVGCDRDEWIVDRSFVRRRSEIANTRYAKYLPPDTGKRVLMVNGNWYSSTDDVDYALLLAQRNPGNGHVQMVLCGLTGPGTYNLARIVESGQPSETLPPLRQGTSRPPILVAVFRLTQTSQSKHGGRSEHSALDWDMVMSPVLLKFRANKWRFPE